MKGDMFVNSDCIGCEACNDILPHFFGVKDDKAYVKRQPQTREERLAFVGIKQACPVNAIRRKLK